MPRSCGIVGLAPLAYSDVQVKRDIANLRAATAKVKVAGAFLDRLAFSVEHRFPVLQARAGENAEAGQMAFAPAELIANRGIALLQLGEFEIAQRSFDQALAGELPDEIRAATLNNRGLARRNMGNRVGAIEDFEGALAINPDLTVARQNLAETQRPER